MRIQRSTFDFLMVSAILGSVILVTTFLGFGAGTLTILFWVIVILIRLKRGSQPKAENSETEHSGDPD